MGDTAIGSNNRKNPLNLSAISILVTGLTDFLRIKKEINGEHVVFAVDVAKTMQFALLGDEHG